MTRLPKRSPYWPIVFVFPTAILCVSCPETPIHTPLIHLEVHPLNHLRKWFAGKQATCVSNSSACRYGSVAMGAVITFSEQIT